MQPEQFLTHSLQDMRIARVLQAAIEGADPGLLVARQLEDLALPPHSRCFLLGLGKAAEAMTRSAADALGGFEAALVITKHRSRDALPRMTILETGHPLPDRRSLAAGHAIMRFISNLHADDLLVCLISGGGSALATCPVVGVSLRDLQALTSAALASGASIEEINVVRRQLDRVKGGGLASATKAYVVSLILSDVIGDRLEAIASGPTAPNPTGSLQAVRVLQQFKLQVPASIDRALTIQRTETGIPMSDRVSNIIVGNCATAVSAALNQARQEGLASEILDTPLQGEAQDVGKALATRLAVACRTRERPFCLLAAGETTVTLTSHGVGGRNQELALAAVEILDKAKNSMLIALATDGNDGFTSAAGAVVTGESKRRAGELGMEVGSYLSRHDAYPFFKTLGDLLQTGYTGTNVDDLILLLGL
jgi:glycerate 2-kinase